MNRLPFIHFIFLLLLGSVSWAQEQDSIDFDLKMVPDKFISEIDKKIKKYDAAITGKTERALTKLSRWETKIERILQKTSPQTADRLFGNNQLTFTMLLHKLQQGKAVALPCQPAYNKYRDDLTTSLDYLSCLTNEPGNGLISRITCTGNKLRQIAAKEDSSEALQQFIKERKRHLAEQAINYIGSSRYLRKINKEAYYFLEAFKNYREIFNDPKKAEEILKNVLNRVPAFSEFLHKNSMLAGLFDLSPQSARLIAGMQTRNNVQQLIQGRISNMDNSARELMSNNLQAAQAQLCEIKAKLNSGSGSSDPPNFKPNNQKSKTFGQRIEYGLHIQFSRGNSIVPSGTDISLSLGYKLTDRLIAGLGTGYKMSFGNINKIHFSNQGISLKGFAERYLKRQIFIYGGFEMNYLDMKGVPNQNLSVAVYPDMTWQQSALLGVTKKLNMKTKWFKTTNVQLLYDFFGYRQLPASQPVLFRIGYNF